MKILYHSVSPLNKNSYGRSTNEIVYRLLEKHQVDIYAWFGLQQTELLYPLGREQGKEERWVRIVGNPDSNTNDNDQWNSYINTEAHKYNLVISHSDLWCSWQRLQNLKGSRWVNWVVGDHSPVPAPHRMMFAADVFAKGVPMTKWFEQELRKCPQIDNDKIAPAIYHGVDLDTFYPSLDPKIKVPDGCEFFVISVADNKGNRENLTGMLEGFAKFLADTRANAHYYIHAFPQSTHGYNLRNCIQICEELYGIKMQDKVSFKEDLVLPDSFMRDLYSRADCQLMIIQGGSWEAPIAEAGACGTPSIVADFSAPPELIGHGDRGLVIPVAAPLWMNMTSSRQMVTSPVNIAKALTIYYENHKLRAMHGDLMQKWVKENATWDIVCKQWLDFLDGLEDDIRSYKKPYFAIIGSDIVGEDKLMAERMKGKVLDIGCGRGTLIACLNQDGCQAEGVDISEYAVKLCQGKGLKAQVASAESLPFKDNEFDYACSGHVLEHCDDYMKAIRESLRVAKCGAIHIVPGYEGRDMTHRRHFTREMLEEICQSLNGASFWPVEGAQNWVLEIKK